MMDFPTSIDQELNKTLKEKVVHHRSRFIHLFKARYLEMLPSLIKYQNAGQVAVDFMKVEIALRNGYDVVIGETRAENIQVIGYATSQLTKSNPADLWSTRSLEGKDIKFIIPEHLRQPYYKEISETDSCATGNFVVIRNKNINYISDIEIINHYVDELAEIVMSRFSISMQVKINTIFMGEPNDESLNEIISDIYNGNPFIKATKLFDPNEQIFFMQNEGIAANFAELKREYQNKISELNNMIGMNSLAVEKSSGVSDTEAESNMAFTTANANINLDGRNNGLFRLNKRYETQIEAMYNDEVVSEFGELHKEQEKEEGAEPSNDNSSV